MNGRPLIALALAVGLWWPATLSLGQRPPAAQSFDTFKMLRTRNIFDPDRRPPPSPNATPARPVTPLDYVALTGTMVTKDKSLAFFSGSRAEFDQVLAIRAKIAEATITNISPGGVTIELGGKATTVAVGWTLPLNGAASAPSVPPPPADAADAAVAAPLPAAAPLAPPVAGSNPLPPPPMAAAGVSPTPGAPPTAPTPNEDVARMMRERRLHEVQ